MQIEIGLTPVVLRSISHVMRLFSQMPPAISSGVLNVFDLDYKKPIIYSKIAISTSRLVCQCLRQINSAFNDLKKLSTAELSNNYLSRS